MGLPNTDIVFAQFSLLVSYLGCSIVLDMLLSMSLQVVVALHGQFNFLLCLGRVADSTGVEHSCDQPPKKCQLEN